MKMQEWLDCPFSDLQIADLPQYSYSRIENVEPLKDYERKITHSLARRLGMEFDTLKTLNNHLKIAINSPSTWLH